VKAAVKKAARQAEKASSPKKVMKASKRPNNDDGDFIRKDKTRGKSRIEQTSRQTHPSTLRTEAEQ
jgi:hypothetical protein